MAVLMLQSCQGAGGKAPPLAGRYVVTARKSMFYHYGPAQASGPDGQLAKGTQLTVSKREPGYSQVILDDGRTGYVPTEDIAPALPEAAATPPPAKSRRDRPEPMPPPGPITPLPLPEQPTPNFRF